MSVQAIQSATAGQGAGSLQAIQAQQMQEAQAVADPQAVEAFQAAMKTSEVEKLPFVSQVAETWQSVQKDHQGLLHRIKELSATPANRGLTVKELTELQYNVANLSFMQEVVTGVAKKASDAMQTLIKNS